MDFASSKLNLVYTFGHLFSETQFSIILSVTEVGQFISYVQIFRLKSCTGSFNLPIRATCLTHIIVQLVALIIYGMGDLKF